MITFEALFHQRLKSNQHDKRDMEFEELFQQLVAFMYNINKDNLV